ncbi:MAG: hypothetical protein LBH01_08870 [Verrucomicrobiales bacterium]|nr:hypothetical protein [Verrucomicrobiales bacterium]
MSKNVGSEKIAQRLRFELIQLIILLLVFCSGGLLYLVHGDLYDMLAFLYPFLIGLLVMRLVWRIVSIQSHSLSRAIDQMSKEDGPSLSRMGIGIHNHVLWMVLGGYVVISVAFAITFHLTGALKDVSGVLNVTNSLSDCFYFSLVTLGSVGCNDFVPVGIGRWLVSGEVLISLGYHMIVIGAAVNYFSKFLQQ